MLPAMWSVSRIPTARQRRERPVVIGGTAVVSTGYSYDRAGRLLTVDNGTNSAPYSYVANSRLARCHDFWIAN